MTLEPAGGASTAKGLSGLSGLAGLGGASAAAAPKPAAASGENTDALKKEIDDLKAQLEAAKSATAAAGATAEDLSTKPTLGYWRIRGLAQPIRVMLTYGGVEFTD